MFLGCLKDNSQKEFFYHLAMVVSIAEGSIEKALANKISIPAAGEVEEKRGIWGSAFAFMDSTAADSFLDIMISEEESRTLQGFCREMDWVASPRDFKEVLNEKLVDSIHRFKTDKEVKKKVIGILVEHDLEIGDQEVIDNLTMYTDEVRQDVLDKMLTHYLGQVGELDLSVAQSRSIIFELAAIGYADTRFEGYEVSVVESINAALGLDEEYLDEAREIIARITEAASEASDLIHE